MQTLQSNNTTHAAQRGSRKRCFYVRDQYPKNKINYELGEGRMEQATFNTKEVFYCVKFQSSAENTPHVGSIRKSR